MDPPLPLSLALLSPHYYATLLVSHSLFAISSHPAQMEQESSSHRTYFPNAIVTTDEILPFRFS